MRYRLGEFLLDTQRELLIGPAGVANLRPQAYRLLCFLVERAPALVSRDALMDELWGHHALSPNVIPQTVSELRQALGDDPQQARFIETRHRRGYAFIAPVEILADESPAWPVAAVAVSAEGSDPASERPAVAQPGGAAVAGTSAWPRYAALWLTLGALFLVLAGWVGWIALRPRPGPAVAEVAVNPPGLRLESAPAALGAYLGLLARAAAAGSLPRRAPLPGRPHGGSRSPRMVAGSCATRRAANAAAECCRRPTWPPRPRPCCVPWRRRSGPVLPPAIRTAGRRVWMRASLWQRRRWRRPRIAMWMLLPLTYGWRRRRRSPDGRRCCMLKRLSVAGIGAARASASPACAATATARWLCRPRSCALACARARPNCSRR
ncbi:MAG: winged helix-turn-helix domain-containing protein [Rhodanobacteraceae bacterium]|nr:winged helix-turn-helix domain-containing protein [Rhodanobacteraceae bacterium]